MKRAVEEAFKPTKLFKRIEGQLEEETLSITDGLAKHKSDKMASKFDNKDRSAGWQAFNENHSGQKKITAISTPTRKKSLPSERQKQHLKPEQNVKSLQMKVKPENSLQEVMLNDIKVLVQRIEQVESNNIQLQSLITHLEQQNSNLKTVEQENQKLDKELLTLKDTNRVLEEEIALKQKKLEDIKGQMEELRNQNKKLLKTLDETKKKHRCSSLDFDEKTKELKNDLYFNVKVKQKLLEKNQMQKEDLQKKTVQLRELETELMQQRKEFQDQILNFMGELEKLNGSHLDFKREKSDLTLDVEKPKETATLKTIEIKETSKELQKVMHELQNNIGNWEEERSRIMKRIEELETENSFLSMQTEESRNIIKNFEKEASKLKELQNQVEEEEKINQTLREELESKEKEIHKLRINLDLVVDTISNEKMEAEREKEMIAEQRLSLKRLSKALSFKRHLMNERLKRKTSLSDKTCQVNIMEENSKKRREQFARKRNAELDSSVNNTKSKQNKHKRKSIKIKIENNKPSDDLLQLSDSIKQDLPCRHSSNRLEKKKRALSSEIYKVCKPFRERETTFWAKYNEILIKYTRVKKDNENLLMENKQRSRSLERQQEKCKTLDAKYQKTCELQKHFATLKEDLAKLKRSYRTLLEEHNSLKLELQKEQEENAKLLKDNNEIRQLSKEYNSTVEYLQQCYGNYSQGNFNVSAFIDLQNRCKELEEECDKLKSRNAELDEQYSKFASEISVLRQECEKVKEDDVTSSNIPS